MACWAIGGASGRMRPYHRGDAPRQQADREVPKRQEVTEVAVGEDRHDFRIGRRALRGDPFRDSRRRLRRRGSWAVWGRLCHNGDGWRGDGSCLELLASDKLRPAVFRADRVSLGGLG